MLQKKKYTTPTTRFASVINLVDNNWEKKKKLIKKKNLKLHKKIFYKNTNYGVSNNWKLNFGAIVLSHLYNKKPYQLIFTAKSVFNQNLTIPGIENLIAGKIIYNFTLDFEGKNFYFLGSQIILEKLPYYIFLSFLTNNLNNKWTYAKSSGTFGLKVKGKKTVKLIIIKLPSEKIYYFKKTTKCFIGKNYNFFNNKFVEGKWGFTIHKKKKISVRGVAMNPVDHPNGGRTKAKQPEKSPWGWIAKHKK